MHEFRSRLFGRGPHKESQLLGAKQSRGADGDTGLHSVAVPREQGRTSNTRDEDRHRLSQEMVEITGAGERRQVELINLSGGGAMISGESLQPRLWDRLELHLGDGVAIECVVRWIKGDRVGLEFAHETRIDCPPEQRNALLRAVLERNFPGAAQFDESADAPASDAPAEEAADEHRSDTRHPLIWSGTLHYDFQSTPVRLRNISTHGALIECSTSLPVGAEPYLEIGEAGSLFATVSWTCGDQVGLRFKEPFDLSALSRAKPQVAPARWVAPDYLRVTGQPSPWDKHWQRLSLGKLSEELDGFLKR